MRSAAIPRTAALCNDLLHADGNGTARGSFEVQSNATSESWLQWSLCLKTLGLSNLPLFLTPMDHY